MVEFVVFIMFVIQCFIAADVLEIKNILKESNEQEGDFIKRHTCREWAKDL